MAARGIKSKIAINIVFLLLLSAIITDILVVVVVQSVMMRDAITHSRKFAESVGHLFFVESAAHPSALNARQSLASHLVMAQDRIETLYVSDLHWNLLHQQNSHAYPIQLVKEHMDSAVKTQETVIKKMGYEWALFWWHPSAISISSPILVDTQPVGVISAIVPMRPIYAQLKKYHNPIFIYILINTAVLTVVGLYRIFKLYLRPIHRIVQQADGFQEESDIFFAFRQEDNELNRLSSALNRMLTRISSDKSKLQATVADLEQANIELKRTQKEMIRAEKMASIGRLASGIAHEIGNPIGIVLGYLEMLKQNRLDEADRLDFLKRTEDEVQRISTVIRQLLDMARPKEADKGRVIVNALIQDVIEVMQLQPAMNDISIDPHFEATDDAVWGNEDQLRQVFLNLMLNAADAINGTTPSEDGQISIRTSNSIPNDTSSPTMLKVTFEDDGGGIDFEKLQNIFDPFYTTKEPGKGTGLGLAVSYMLIDGMGGSISAESGPGQGARFSILLPLVGEEIRNQKPRTIEG